jgi:hypothetical protein
MTVLLVSYEAHPLSFERFIILMTIQPGGKASSRQARLVIARLGGLVLQVMISSK